LLSGGVPHFNLTVTTNTLPPGLNFNHDDGTLYGTPNVLGKKPFTFTVQITDQLGGSVSGSFQLRIYPAVTITTKSLKSGKVGKAYKAKLAAKGGSKEYTCTWSLISGSLPDGLHLDASGLIWGTPTAKGTFNLTFQAADELGGKPQKNLPLMIK